MHDYYYQKYVERWLTEEATISPLQEAKIEHPPDKRKLEAQRLAEEAAEKAANGEGNEQSTEPVDGETSQSTQNKDQESGLNSESEQNQTKPQPRSSKDLDTERNLSKEEELNQYKAPPKPTVGDNIEAAIASLGQGLVQHRSDRKDLHAKGGHLRKNKKSKKNRKDESGSMENSMTGEFKGFLLTASFNLPA